MTCNRYISAVLPRCNELSLPFDVPENAEAQKDDGEQDEGTDYNDYNCTRTLTTIFFFFFNALGESGLM